jgi:hypothetical protein
MYMQTNKKTDRLPVKKVKMPKLVRLIAKYQPEIDFITNCEQERIFMAIEEFMSFTPDSQELVEVLRRRVNEKTR